MVAMPMPMPSTRGGSWKLGASIAAAVKVRNGCCSWATGDVSDDGGLTTLVSNMKKGQCGGGSSAAGGESAWPPAPIFGGSARLWLMMASSWCSAALLNGVCRWPSAADASDAAVLRGGLDVVTDELVVLTAGLRIFFLIHEFQ